MVSARKVIALCAGVVLQAFVHAAFIEPAQAQPRKCISAAGRVTYTDLACPDAQVQGQVSIVDNASDSSEARRALAQAQAEGLAGQQRGPAPALPLTRGPSGHGPTTLSSTCAAKKRDYEIAVSMIRKDIALMNRRHQAATQACGRTVEIATDHERLATETEIRRQRAARGVGHGPGGPTADYVPPVVMD